MTTIKERNDIARDIAESILQPDMLEGHAALEAATVLIANWMDAQDQGGISQGTIAGDIDLTIKELRKLKTYVIINGLVAAT